MAMLVIARWYIPLKIQGLPNDFWIQTAQHDGHRAKLVKICPKNLHRKELPKNPRFPTWTITLWQINIDPENHQFLMETNLPTPILPGSMLIYQRVD